MPKYVLAFRGGTSPETTDQAVALQMAWAEWLGGLGQDLVDAGGPFGAGATVTTPGDVIDGPRSGLSGYTIIEAESLDDACAATTTIPIFSGDGDVDVYEVLSM